MSKRASTIGAIIAALFFQAQTIAPVSAQTPPNTQASQTTITLIEVPRPWYAPRGTIVRRMVEKLPVYQSADGLVEKHFILSDQKTLGGFYRWEGRAQADAFFNEAWAGDIQRRYGKPAQREWFTSPLAIDGPVPASSLGEGAMVTLVRVATPPGVTRERLEAEFQQSAPRYQSIPGLSRKWFIVTQDNRFGGVYLWQSRAAADAFFTDAYQERVKRTYGVNADIRFFEAPLTMQK